MTSTRESQLTRRDLVSSMAVTTVLLLLVSCLVLFFSQINILDHMNALIRGVPSSILDYALLIFVPALVVGLEWLLFRFVPQRYWYDPLNDQLGKKFSLFELALFFAVGAVSEELLFRGVLQNLFGFFIATILFVLIHVRYLKRFFLLGVSLILGCSLGCVYLLSGKLWVVVLCHFLLNMGVMMMIKSGNKDNSVKIDQM